jgi:hypothetical protein
MYLASCAIYDSDGESAMNIDRGGGRSARGGFLLYEQTQAVRAVMQRWSVASRAAIGLTQPKAAKAARAPAATAIRHRTSMTPKRMNHAGGSRSRRAVRMRLRPLKAIQPNAAQTAPAAASGRRGNARKIATRPIVAWTQKTATAERLLTMMRRRIRGSAKI